VQGTDLSHAVLGKEGPDPDSVYLQILGPGWPHRGNWVGFWLGNRTKLWVSARSYGSANVLLVDHDNDPYEMNNLAGRPEFADVQAMMEKRLGQWIEETGDPFDTGERDPDTGMLRLGQVFVHEDWETGTL
jgi:hypothetical protein